MPVVNLSPVANLPQFFDNNGVVLSGGYVYTYDADTFSTLFPTYTDVTGTVANPNPMQLTSSGRPTGEFWLVDGTKYRFVVTMPDGVTPLWTASGVQGVLYAAGSSPVLSVFSRIGNVIAVEGDYSLELLGDVGLSSPVNGQVLTYNGATWANATPAAGGVSSFNTRTGAITLTSGDVTGALGFVPGTGSVTSVGILMAGLQAQALTVNASPVTGAGDILITPNLFAFDAPGVVPQSGGGAINFLRADGSWTAPPGGVPSFNTRTGAITLTSGDVTGALTYTPLNKAGDTMSGALNMGAQQINNMSMAISPASTDAATVGYVLAALSNSNIHEACAAASTTALFSVTYTPGVAGGSPDAGTGVGALITAVGVGQLFLDAHPCVFGERVLIKNQASSLQNGVYTVTIQGDGFTPYQLTRATDFNNSVFGQVEAGDQTFIVFGSTQAATSWALSSVGTQAGGVIKIGTDAITFTQIGSTTSYSAGTGLNLTGTVFSNTGILSVTAGTGLSSTGTQSPTLSNTGVLSFNTRVGAVSLTSLDVTNALGYVPGSGGGTVSSVGISTAGAYASAISVGSSPVTVSGTITLTPNLFSAGVPGVVPASGGGSSNFLRADGSWAAPSGSGVSSFNTRTGAVTLFSSDVTGALGYTPGTGNGSVTSVGVSSAGVYSGALTIGSSPVTGSGTITVTPNLFTSSVAGVVPGSGGGTTNYLRADGNWGSPPGVGTVTSITVAAGTGVSGGGTVTSSGTVTLSIGQAVGTGNNVQFNALGVGVSNSTSGTIVASSNITAYSDKRLKTDIEPIYNALRKVQRMQGVSFKRVDTGEYGIGFIAQDMQRIVPEVVQEGEFLSIAYGNLVAVLVEAVKELSARVQELERK